MFKYLSDVLYKNHNFKLSLLLFGDNSDVNDKFKDNKIIKASIVDDSCKIFLNTYNKCFLVLENIPPNTYGGNTVKGDKILFPQRSFYDMDQALILCIDWLKSKNFKYLFNIDSDGVVKGIGNAPPYHPIVYKNAIEFIRFSPAAVRSIDGNLYEGISIKTDKGPFAAFTCTDFFTFASIIRNYIFNSYSNNLQLLQLGMNIFLKSK